VFVIRCACTLEIYWEGQDALRGRSEDLVVGLASVDKFGRKIAVQE